MARLNAGSAKLAALDLGIAYSTEKNHLNRAIYVTGADNFTQVVVRLWPQIKDRIRFRSGNGTVISFQEDTWLPPSR